MTMETNAKVLIIDDEPETTTYFSTVLEDNGFAPRSAHSADEGLAVLKEEKPDLILLDLMMPYKTGVNLFNKIKKDPRYRDVPVIIVTGIRDRFSEDHRAFFDSLRKSRPSAYLEKPVEPEQLIGAVKRSLEAMD
jgi:adenylate cyclase